jgi:hypothetical protein
MSNAQSAARIMVVATFTYQNLNDRYASRLAPSSANHPLPWRCLTRRFWLMAAVCQTAKLARLIHTLAQYRN